MRGNKGTVRWMRRLAWASALSAVFYARDAQAQGAAAAAALSKEADKLLAAGRHEEACPKLKESDRLEPKLSTRYRLAGCYEKTGRPASAWALYEEVAGAAQSAAEDPARKARRGDYEKLANAAHARASELKANLPTLTIVVPEPLRSLSGLEIKIDDKTIGEVLWGQPIPVDLVEHLIIASAPGKKAWEERKKIDSMGQNIEVIVPGLKDANAAEKKEEPSDEGMPWQQKAAIGLGIGGIIGLGIGGAGGILAISNHQDALSACPDKLCPNAAKKQEALASEDKAGTFAAMANIGLISGGALALGAAVLWFMAPSKPRSPAEQSRINIKWMPVVQKNALGSAWIGSF